MRQGGATGGCHHCEVAAAEGTEVAAAAARPSAVR